MEIQRNRDNEIWRYEDMNTWRYRNMGMHEAKDEYGITWNSMAGNIECEKLETGYM